jgi:hypothetical protein
MNHPFQRFSRFVSPLQSVTYIESMGSGNSNPSPRPARTKCAKSTSGDLWVASDLIADHKGVFLGPIRLLLPKAHWTSALVCGCCKTHILEANLNFFSLGCPRSDLQEVINHVPSPKIMQFWQILSFSTPTSVFAN